MPSNDTAVLLEEPMLLEDNVNEVEIETIDDNSSPSSVPSSRTLTDRNNIISIPVEKVIRTESTSKRTRYLATYQQSWEKKEEAMYKTYEFDLFGTRKEKLICWLYSTDNISMRCRLCEKYTKTKNSNGQENLWCTIGYKTLKIDKIKQHQQSETHKNAQALELQVSSKLQPGWVGTQSKQRSKHQEAIENLIISSIHICQTDQSLNTFSSLWVHNEVIEKLRQKVDAEWIGGSPCAAHTFSLVGSQAAYTLTDDNKLGPISPSISKLESCISKIYNYFSRSSSRQTKLKNWQRFLEKPELQFKRLFDISWSCIRDSIKPIIENIQPNSQAFFIVLEEISSDWTCSNTDREISSELRKQLIRDDFLFIIHFHHDLHECVLGPVTKVLQDDDFSYLELMKLINEKKQMLRKWIEQVPPVWGPSLSNYIRESKKHFYGLFKIEPADRKKLSQECCDHIERLLQEIDRRFVKCPLRENLSILFDPNYLIHHREIVDQPEYGRKALNYVREKYKNLPSFDKTAVQAEWELIKIPLAEYLKTSMSHTRKYFWKSFILHKQTVNEQFPEQFKNILVLLSIYLLSASNSAECERGFSAANRVQTNGRSRLMVDTLDVLLNVRLLLTDDIRSARCQFVTEKAFESWNDYESKRRYTRTKLLIDVADDYEPTRQTRRQEPKRKLISNPDDEVKRKKQKVKAIKYNIYVQSCQVFICSKNSTNNEIGSDNVIDDITICGLIDYIDYGYEINSFLLSIGVVSYSLAENLIDLLIERQSNYYQENQDDCLIAKLHVYTNCLK
ncbi:unnamed protein product [Rotaria sp. Silwood1]|nr:unnamed protein product [Rotaria sp. Silwood1]